MRVLSERSRVVVVRKEKWNMCLEDACWIDSERCEFCDKMARTLDDYFQTGLLKLTSKKTGRNKWIEACENCIKKNGLMW